MKMLKAPLESFRYSVRAKQSFYLLLINFAGIPLGILTSVILTRSLGAEGFGNYSFIISLFTFAVLITTFGFFQAGNRALVLNNDKKIAMQYYGAELLILLLMFFVMTCSLLVYSFVDNNLKQKGLLDIFLLSLPLGFVFLSNKYIEILLQADGRISLLSTYRLLTKIAYLLALVFLSSYTITDSTKTLIFIFYLYFLTQTIVFLFILWRLKPSFISLSYRIKEIWYHNKSFGFNVYIGSVFAVSFTSLSQILIGYFSETNDSVGFYTLALTFSGPLALIPNTIATVYYKDFSKSKKIPVKLLKVTILTSFMALLCLWLIIGRVIVFLYGDDFTSVVRLSYIVSFGVLIHGFGDFYNRFLGANGQGVALRNSAFIVGGIAMLLSLVLIPAFGEYGAAIAKLIVAIVYLIMIFYYYRIYIKNEAA